MTPPYTTAIPYTPTPPRTGGTSVERLSPPVLSALPKGAEIIRPPGTPGAAPLPAGAELVRPYGSPGGPRLPPGATLVGPLAVRIRVKSYSVRTPEGHEEIFPECDLSELPADVRRFKTATMSPLVLKKVWADGREEIALVTEDGRWRHPEGPDSAEGSKGAMSESTLWLWDGLVYARPEAEDRDWNESERIVQYSKLEPFTWFEATPSDEATTGEDLMRRLYEGILTAAVGDMEAQHYYFDSSAMGEGSGTFDSPCRSLWHLRCLLMDGRVPNRKVVCHLARGSHWTWEQENAWMEGARSAKWRSSVPDEVFDAAVAAFLGHSMLRCCEERSNVTIAAYGQDGLPAPILDGSGGGTMVDVRDPSTMLDSVVDLCAVGLLLDIGHAHMYVSDLSFRNCCTGLLTYAGSRDVFYKLEFNDPYMAVAIDLQPDTSKIAYWGEYFYRDTVKMDGRIRTAAELGHALNGLIRGYPIAESDYSRRILIGFCAFRSIGANLPEKNRTDHLDGFSQGTMAIRINVCATEICVNHCTFDGCQDCVTGQICSSGHLIFCNSFRNTLYDGAQGPYWEDGNGVDLINAAPRTVTAWNYVPLGQPLEMVRVPKSTRIFDNLFYHCQGTAIIFHFGTRYVDIFNNYFVGGGGAAIWVSADTLGIVDRDSMVSTSLGWYDSLADRIRASTGFEFDVEKNRSRPGRADSEDALEAGDLGPQYKIRSVRIYRTCLSGLLQ